MSNAIEQLNFIIPVISISLVVIITSINVYFKIRRKFPYKVNCWFCNTDTKVPYNSQNCWTCLFCEQYNGFTKDGDYNCEIPAQHSIKFNKTINGRNSDSFFNVSSANEYKKDRLCGQCNRNQELKVQQLASFIPENEDNFDDEVEEYEKELQQTYRLCLRCESVLRRKLNKVKSNILGSKLAQLGARGFKIFDITSATNTKSSIHTKRRIILKVCISIIILLAIINIMKTIKSTDLSKSRLDAIFPTDLSHAVLVVFLYISTMIELMTASVNYILNLSIVAQSISFMTTLIYLIVNPGKVFINDTSRWLLDYDYQAFETTFLIHLAGILISIVILFLNTKKITTTVWMLLAWSLGMALPWSINNSSIIVDIVKIFLAGIIFVTSILNRNVVSTSYRDIQNANGSFHRISSDYESSDVSDESDVEIDFHSSRNTVIGRSRKKHNISSESIQSAASSIFSLAPKQQKIDKYPSEFGNLNESTSSLMNRSLPSLNNYMSSTFGTSQMDGRLSRDSLYQTTSNGFSNTNNLHNYESFASLNNSFRSTDSRNNFVDFNSTQNHQFGSTLDLNDDDFNTSIKSLKISANLGSSFSKTFTFNDSRHYNESIFNPSVFSASPVRTSANSLRQRNHILSPSRLNLTNSDASRVGQNSWVAGGFWSGTSPQKKQIIQMKSPPPLINPPDLDFCPIKSRTSSQSSGFESRPGSVHGCGPNNNSRDNSICGDLDKVSVFSEPAYKSSFRDDFNVNSCNIRSTKKTKTHYSTANNFLNNSPSLLFGIPQPIFPRLSVNRDTIIQPSIFGNFQDKFN